MKKEEWGGPLKTKLQSLEEALVANRQCMSATLAATIPFFPRQSLGLSSAAASMFGNDGSELILHFVTQCNAQLTQVLEEEQKLVQLSQAE